MEGQVPHRFGSVSFVATTLVANDPKVGDLTFTGDEIYRFVYNAGNSQISINKGAILSAVTGYSVTVSSVTSADFLVGVCKHATIPTAAYGWLVVHGFSQIDMGANNSAAAGACITLGTDGVFAGYATAIANLGNVCGKLMSAAASGTSAPAFISCL